MTARVIVLVEGQTEEKFVREQLVPELAAGGVFLTATTSGRPRNRAGVPKWSKARRELVRLLKEDRSRRVTTMFDYYGMPLDWPGRKESSEQPHGHRAGTVERRVKAAIAEALPDDLSSNRFIPYVQMYEFEALLFAEPRTLAQVVSRDARPTRITRELQRISEAFGTPEEIDDDPNTAPLQAYRAPCPRLPEDHRWQHGGQPHRLACDETEMPALQRMAEQVGGAGPTTESGERAT